MKAFISYSHKDESMLDLLHKHLAQLQRDKIISAWTDREINAGGEVDQTIAFTLNSCDIFIALLSPDYILSNYCYEKEFNTALELQKQSKIIIIPIIVESCDWLNTPFQKFKALPKDGKAISTWDNKNTAVLDIIQNMRKLINAETEEQVDEQTKNNPIPFSRNYRVQKDFDTIEKMEFVETTFNEIKEYLKRYMQEVTQIDNIKTRILDETLNDFICLLVNRNKINTEAQLTISIDSNSSNSFHKNSKENQIIYTISKTAAFTFRLTFDEYHLFWTEADSYYSSQKKNEWTSKYIADKIWSEWLESVGIM